MIKKIYGNVIFTYNVEELKGELKNKNNNIFIGDIDNIGEHGYIKLNNILHSECGFNTVDNNCISTFASMINSIHANKYDYVYIHIKNIDKITSKQSLYCYKVNFFNLLNSITNKQIYFIIDIKYKDYVFNQIEEYNKHINRLRSFGEIHNQVIFVDDIEKVKQNINTETEMFKEIDGNKCKDIDLFYDQLIKGWKFPDYFKRNFGVLDDWLVDFGMWDDFKEGDCSMIFHYIKDISSILPDNTKSRVIICYLLHEVDNERMFYLIDKKDKEYFLEQVRIWNEKYKYKHN